MRTADFDYELPERLIAQVPPVERGQSRLLVLHRSSGRIFHKNFINLADDLIAGDVLILNDSRVIPARLRAVKTSSGGAVELLLLEENAVNDWWAMVRPGKRVRPGSQLQLLDPHGQPANVRASVFEKNDEGHARLRFHGTPNILDCLQDLGEVPLPPYIVRPAYSSANVNDSDRYQTVFAQAPGSVAAPTAGLHFTREFLSDLRARGVQVHYVTLHVGLGTFAPVKSESLEGHTMHEERFHVPLDTAQAINAAKESGRRIVAVGTTTVRVLESLAAANSTRILDGPGRTRIFIFPPYQFRIVDMLLTNFHLPRSTLLMLVSAFAAPGTLRGRDRILAAYTEAIRQEYRFFSYGDAMLIV